MAFYPEVNKGDKFTPNVLLANDVRRLVNAANGFSGGKIGIAGNNALKVQVYNNTPGRLDAGSAITIQLNLETARGEPLPAVSVTHEDEVWGVLPEPLEPNQVGPCVMAGVVSVCFRSLPRDATHAKPDLSHPGYFVADRKGAPIIRRKGAWADILIGAAIGDIDIDGPFDVVLDTIDGDPPTYKVCCRNTALDPDTLEAGYVYLGPTHLLVPAMVVDAAPGVVYLDVTVAAAADSGGSIQHELAGEVYLADALPEVRADERRYVLRLAEVSQDDNSNWSVSMCRTPADVEILGRWT